MKVRIGVLGAYRGKSMIDVLMHYREDAEIVAICDFFEPALNNVRNQALRLGLKNISYYADFETFLKHDMDAVCLANYANEHAPFAIACLDARMHVISEVMPCETMAQAACFVLIFICVNAIQLDGDYYEKNSSWCRWTWT